MSEREAQELVAKADKKATSSSWFFGGNKYEEAAELYTQAGNIFKLAKRCKLKRPSLFCSTDVDESNALSFWPADAKGKKKE